MKQINTLQNMVTFHVWDTAEREQAQENFPILNGALICFVH